MLVPIFSLVAIPPLQVSLSLVHPFFESILDFLKSFFILGKVLIKAGKSLVLNMKGGHLMLSFDFQVKDTFIDARIGCRYHILHLFCLQNGQLQTSLLELVLQLLVNLTPVVLQKLLHLLVWVFRIPTPTCVFSSSRHASGQSRLDGFFCRGVVSHRLLRLYDLWDDRLRGSV